MSLNLNQTNTEYHRQQVLLLIKPLDWDEKKKLLVKGGEHELITTIEKSNQVFQTILADIEQDMNKINQDLRKHFKAMNERKEVRNSKQNSQTLLTDLGFEQLAEYEQIVQPIIQADEDDMDSVQEHLINSLAKAITGTITPEDVSDFRNHIEVVDHYSDMRHNDGLEELARKEQEFTTLIADPNQIQAQLKKANEQDEKEYQQFKKDMELKNTELEAKRNNAIENRKKVLQKQTMQIDEVIAKIEEEIKAQKIAHKQAAQREVELQQQAAQKKAEEEKAVKIKAEKEAELQKQAAQKKAEEEKAAKIKAEKEAELQQQAAQKKAEEEKAAKIKAEKEAELQHQAAQKKAEEEKAAKIKAEKEAELQQQAAQKKAEEEKAAKIKAQKQVIISQKNRLDYYPIFSTFSGLHRALSGLVSLITNVAKTIFCQQILGKGVQAAGKDIYHIGRGLLAMIPIVGNVALYKFDQSRITTPDSDLS